VAVLRDASTIGDRRIVPEADRPARALGLTLRPLLAHSADEIASLIDVAVQEGAEALFHEDNPLLGRNQARVMQVLGRHRLPALGIFREFAAGGGLMAYGTSLWGLYHRAAYYVDRILKGTKPADLPVEQPTTFDFVINLKTAHALGLTIPPHVLLQATEVIQ
jgi:putative tryptophan/tyrosine transport system substrate-binding protein